MMKTSFARIIVQSTKQTPVRSDRSCLPSRFDNATMTAANPMLDPTHEVDVSSELMIPHRASREKVKL